MGGACVNNAGFLVLLFMRICVFSIVCNCDRLTKTKTIQETNFRI